jgi:hypothetical protein
MDTTIRGNADVAALLGTMPLGNVPPMLTAAELRRQRVGNLALAAGCIAAIGIVLLAVR